MCNYHCPRCGQATKSTRGKHPRAKIASLLASLALVVLGTGCTTMSVPTMTTGTADSYAQHQEKNGLVLGVKPLTDKREIEHAFNINLLDKGLLPVLVVAENQTPADSFIIAKEKVAVLNKSSGQTNTYQGKPVASGSAGGAIALAGAAALIASPAAAPLIFVGLKMASNATVIQHNIGDKEFYSRTLGPGEKARGYVYFQFSKESPPQGDYHVIARIKNSSSGAETLFDFPVSLTVPK